MPFKDPWILLLIPVFLPVIFLLGKRKKPPAFRFTSTTFFSGIRSSWKIRLNNGLIFARLSVLVFFLIALAGPRSVLKKAEITTEGIEIVLTVDVSGSMAAEDFKIDGRRVNRLSVVKDVVRDFIDNRNGDYIGLVVFAAQAYMACPLTTDYQWLTENLKRVELGVISEDGTAIGSAIASAAGRLEDTGAKSKVIILLTDGVHNAGEIDPLTAAEAADSLDIKIYTIGAGSNGMVPFPVKDFFGRDTYRHIESNIDEKALKEIAGITSGQYFRATDTESLRQIYKEIDQLEKNEIKKTGYNEYEQLFVKFLLAGLVILLFEIVLSNTVLTRIP